MILAIGNCVYLPISEDNCMRREEQLYIGASMSGYVFQSQVVTRKDIEKYHNITSNSDKQLKEVANLNDLTY